MEALLTYLLDASAGIVLFYSVFWFFLRKETFHVGNRIYLIAALLSAVFLPLFPLRYSLLVETTPSQVQTIADSFKSIPVTVAGTVENSGYNWHQILLLFYFGGVILFSLRLLVQSLVLLGLILSHKAQKFNGVYILENSKYEFPFSFFNIVFIHPKYNTQEELPEILAHEKVHIRENHWFDLLIIELLTVIFWFNPFIWFFERSIKQNHEYLADRGVLAQGHSVSRYRALLVNQLMGVQVIGLTNNLNFALNANRLKMMTKKKTSVVRRIRFMWVLPAFALLLFAFAEPEYRVKEPVEKSIGEPTSEQEIEKTVKVAGFVTDEEGDPLPGTSIVVKGGTVGTVVDRDGTFALEIPENSDIVLSFVGKKTLVAHYDKLISGTKKDGSFTRKYVMEDAVQVLYNRTYSGEQLVPPPPPPPPAKSTEKMKESIPPPPPPVKKEGETVFYVVEDLPKYPGGFDAMQNYVAKMQQKLAQGKNLKGKAKVSFTVDEKGKVSDIKVVEKDNDGAGKGAVAIASEMPDWAPGKQRGKAVPVKYLLPVEFK